VTDPYAVLSPVDGQRFPRIPDWQLVGDAEYRFPVSSNAEAFLGASLNYQSGQIATFGVPGGENVFFEMPSYTLIDLRAGVETDRWRLSIWGKNITNKFYTTDVSRIIDSVSRAVGMPATYGVTAAIKF
jgi:outer membrane receptor protein involved in Fe transport